MTLLAGVGYSEDGQAQAGMGTDFGDYDGDGWLDIVVTNLDFEYNARLSKAATSGMFTDASYASGLRRDVAQLRRLRHTFFFDYDNDGWLDVFVANGHIIDNIAEFGSVSTYQANELPVSQRPAGERSSTSPMNSGDVHSRSRTSRAARRRAISTATATKTCFITRCGQSAVLLANEGGDANGWIAVKLRGNGAPTASGVGTHGSASTSARIASCIKEVKAGSSYLCAKRARAHRSGSATPTRAETGSTYVGRAESSSR